LDLKVVKVRVSCLNARDLFGMTILAKLVKVVRSVVVAIDVRIVQSRNILNLSYILV
jgi:hypothetical protein